ncbi:hypothetical protein [Leisingera sp. ANG-M1]|uniref:hypothetical protein n=1 Tax=Leisingera sp. ANG-M1 TaxID=1577895 RepID=UPI001269F7B3|nr:hypothetical protein [Leisingera sp. ANG-M1]
MSRSLIDLQDFIQNFQTVEDLEQAFTEIFESDEESDENKRCRQGKHGRLFKLAGEELLPLIEWMKIRRPACLGRVIDGNQPYDAEVTWSDAEQTERIEIGRGTNGQQEHLLNVYLSDHGEASGLSEYKREGRGPNARVVVASGKSSTTSKKLMAETLKCLDQVAKKKSSKEYAKDTVLVLYSECMISFNEETQSELRNCAEEIIASYEWSVGQVDVLVRRNGLLFSAKF